MILICLLFVSVTKTSTTNFLIYSFFSFLYNDKSKYPTSDGI